MEEEIARDHCITLTSKVYQFRTDAAYYDIKIRVDYALFKCHRVILAAASQYFDVKFKESPASNVISLTDVVRPQIFREIIRFIYTGKVSIDSNNLYQLLRASDFFQLPSIEKLCFQYVQQNVDEALLHNGGLKMFSYTRATSKTIFGKFIGQYICNNLHYFSKTPEFLKISYEDFIAILDVIPSLASTKSQDVYMHAIMGWIKHTDRSPQDMKLHFNELLKRINFVTLSSNCVKELVRMNIDNLIALRQNGVSIDQIPPHLNAVNSELKEAVDSESLHVYLNAYSDDSKKFITSVFSLCDQSGKATDRRWVNSYRFDSTNSYDVMRTVVLDGRLYCLSTNLSLQSRYKIYKFMFAQKGSRIFGTFSSISLCSDFSDLKPPPFIGDNYDMCGHGKHIYLYNKDWHPTTILPSNPWDTSSFNREDIYVYYREVDIWHSLPVPHQYKFNFHSCMTCDEQMVYFIGGESVFDRNVQGYDHRTPKWISLPSTKYEYYHAACCTHQEKVYVTGGFGSQNNSMEMYDPVAGKWQCMKQMNCGRSNHRMNSFLHSDYLVTAGKDLSQESDIELYNVAENEWEFMTSLYQSVMASDLTYKKHLKVIDMVNYNYRP